MVHSRESGKNGRLNFGLSGDFNALHDLERLADDVGAALPELADAAGLATRGGDTPWPGYDDQPAAEITKRPRGAGEQLATRVRAYELERKHRRGVLQATERELALRLDLPSLLTRANSCRISANACASSLRVSHE